MSIKVNEEGFKGLGWWVSTLLTVPGGIAGGTIGLGCGIKGAIGNIWTDVKTEPGNTTIADLVMQDISANAVNGYLYGADIGATVGGVVGDYIEAYGAKPIATLTATGFGYYVGKFASKPLVVGGIGALLNIASIPGALTAAAIGGGTFMILSLSWSYGAPKLAPSYLGSFIGGLVNKPLVIGGVGAALNLAASTDASPLTAAVAGLGSMIPPLAMSYFAPDVVPGLFAAAGGITSFMLVHNHEERLDFTFE